MAATWRGDLAFKRGDYAAAVPQYRTSLQIAASQDDGIQVINDAVGLTASLLQSGQLDAGLEAAGAVAALAADAGHRTSIGYFRYDYDELVTRSRSSRGADGAALFERGRRLDVNDRVPRILALARQAQEESPHRATPPDAAVAAESSRIAPYA
jgi:hypothetical protein